MSMRLGVPVDVTRAFTLDAVVVPHQLLLALTTTELLLVAFRMAVPPLSLRSLPVMVTLAVLPTTSTAVPRLSVRKFWVSVAVDVAT